MKYGCFWISLLFPLMGFASGGDAADPVAPVLFWVTFLFVSGLIGRYIAIYFNQPGVLGELMMGVVLGNLGYYFSLDPAIVLREGSAIFGITEHLLAGMPLTEAVQGVIPDPFYSDQLVRALGGSNGNSLLKVAYVTDIFSRYGVIFLLFMVGLGSSITALKKTGRYAFQVASLGVIAPMMLGFLVTYLFLPELSFNTDLFIAATLSATSVGITARVMDEIKVIQTPEAQTVLGAAMIDDVLGLIILAVVSSLVMGGVVDIMSILHIVLAAFIFFASTLLLGPRLLQKVGSWFGFLDPWEEKLFVSFVFVMGLSWMATLANLSSIIGAFAAGVIIHDGYFRSNTNDKRNTLSIHDLLSSLEALMAPLFFILVGFQVKLEAFCNGQVLLMAFWLLIAAIFGKLICGIGGARHNDRLLIGIGMLPRGEVGLVFASIGRTIGVISDALFSAVVLMVIVTTFIAPIWLKQRYARLKRD